MPLSACVIVVVVGRGDFDTPCSKLSVYHFVGNDYHASVGDEGMEEFLSEQVLVSWVFGVHCYGGVAQHSLYSGGGDFDEASGIVLEGVLEVEDHSELHLLVVPRDIQ